ncbi:2-nitropropane dioxygenase [Intrasporangium chromatireducens Q5-1]|uniref:2-nitropropane dioxygenase n=1 Tax=Intrasporangium chromatireducens Q5-1 TaxID=584657 RepID=W9GIJ4_9MICO|nr:nitronate monooxygenase [Intrasporangium chromatireducens]EWT04982.1 2-nitropropane dioxygenase [Intrasporangium chromatireducens Q5-1]
MKWQPSGSTLGDQIPAELPIFGFAHSADVIAELCLAGGVGIWGATRDTPEEIEAGLAGIVEAVGNRPFGVDLVLPANMPELDDRALIEAQIPEEHRAFVAQLRQKYDVPDDGQPGMRSRFVRSNEMARRQLDVVLRSKATVVALGVGSPQDAVEQLKSAGKVVVSLIGSPRHAQKALEAGADVLVAQGYDAGGHTGTIGTFSLVPQIVDMAGGVPVLAAGGVATGRHVASALMLGAAGVWTGTLWLGAVEHDLDPELQKMLLAAGVGDTVQSRADSGKTLRQLRSTWTDEWAADAAPSPLPMPLQDILIGDLLGSVDRNRVLDLMHTPAGQGVGYLTEIEHVQEIVGRLVRETEEALGRWSTK